VLVAAISTESETGGTGFAVEADADGEFVGEGRWFGLVDAERAAAEGVGAAASGADDAGALGPAATVGLPEARIEGADAEPCAHGDGRGAVEERLQLGGGDGEAEVFGEGAFEGDDAGDLAIAVDDGPAAVASFDGHGELEHAAAFDFLESGDDAFDHAEAEA
jgi:hypothetical protein